MPYHRRADGSLSLVAGFVGVIGPHYHLNYFTGCGYSASLDEAKVFRTAKGCFCAMTHWQTADYNESPLGEKFWATRRAKPVSLAALHWEIVPE